MLWQAIAPASGESKNRASYAEDSGVGVLPPQWPHSTRSEAVFFFQNGKITEKFSQYEIDA
jgi:hypothetical protein